MSNALNCQDWNQRIQAAEGSFLQSWPWGEFQEAMGKLVARFYVETVTAQFIVQPLYLNKTYVFSPYGPVGTEAGAATLLQLVQEVIAPEHKAIFWRHEGKPALFGGHSVKEIHPHHTWLLDLDNPETLLQGMKQKWRYNIRLAERKGVKIHTSQDSKDVTKVYALLKSTAERQGISIHSEVYYKTMVEVLAKYNMIQLYLAEYQGNIIAGNIMIGFGNTMTYVHGGTDNEHRSVMAPHLLQWQAIMDAHQQCYKTYDFFGIAPPNIAPNMPNHPWAGITRFKQGFGGRLVTHYGTFELPLQRMWYTAYKIMKRLWI